MKIQNLFLSLILVVGTVSTGLSQKVYVQDKDTFEDLKNITILSTKTVDESHKLKKPALQVKFIDHDKNDSIMYYDGILSEKGYVSVLKFKYLLSAMGSISVLTVPFKIRSENSNGYWTAKADVKNAGIYVPLALWDNKRYWIDNSTSSHKFSVGAVIAPMAQELNDANTGGFFNDEDASYSAFMMSTSFALTYTYKNITFALIPAGVDFGFDDGSKKWEHQGRYWAGFGIGIDTKLFGF